MSNLVTFEQAKKLKELGFNVPIREYYESSGYLITQNESRFALQIKRNSELPTEYSAPTVSYALDWIREKKEIYCGVYPFMCGYNGMAIVQDKYNPCTIEVEPLSSHTLASSALLTEILNHLTK
ncbi:hypothetical protein [uncultured Dysgonomonas sp.]|uniref:Uncharacterized protein n=1 Tax=uncultured Dysgonomonas sp. TaxID=206096 RepID=A0A212IXY5_9BACT|nr:hypothetical protein [uncultured Dysgonomonas sp.]SBV91815.1 hypothetical protein KL86DYS1_10439 [uncultured Dysgonomonas sp.]